MSDPVLLDVTDGVATLTLNRPEGMNSLTVDAKVALNEAAPAVAGRRPRPRARADRAPGGPSASGRTSRSTQRLLEAGDPAPLSTVSVHYNPLVTLLRELPFPTIAAINGTAAGAGLGLACALDLRIGAAGLALHDRLRRHRPHRRLGPVLDAAPARRPGRAAALLLLAQPFTAEQALEMGLVNMVVPPEQVLPRRDRARAEARRGSDRGLRLPQAVGAVRLRQHPGRHARQGGRAADAGRSDR